MNDNNKYTNEELAEERGKLDGFPLLTHDDFLSNSKGGEFNTYSLLVSIGYVNKERSCLDMEKYLYENNLEEKLEELKKGGVKVPSIKTIKRHIKKLSNITINNQDDFTVINIINTPNGIAYQIKQSYNGAYYYSIPYKQMVELINFTNSNVLKLYCILTYTCNQKGFIPVTRDYLCRKMGFENTRGNHNKISIMLSGLKKLGYIHIRQEHKTEPLDNGNLKSKTFNYIKLTTYAEWERITKTK